jgi:hypothetical protein
MLILYSIIEHSQHETSSRNSSVLSKLYTCANGDVINEEDVCNRKIDCLDLSDEIGCWQNYTSNVVVKVNISYTMFML